MTPESTPHTQEATPSTPLSKPYDPKDEERAKELEAMGARFLVAKKEELSLESRNESLKRFEGNLKKSVENISSTSRVLLEALHERLEQRLTPLQSSDEFQGMVSVIRNIQNFDGRFTVENALELSTNIRRLSNLMREVQPRRAEQVRESKDNLEKLSYGARSFSGSAEDAANSLGIELEDAKLEEKRKEIQLALKTLAEDSDHVAFVATKMRSNF